MSEESKNLTPIQARLVALLLQGLKDDETWKSVGVRSEEHEAEIKYKLEVPDEVELESYLREMVSTSGETDDFSDADPPTDERRVRLLLRLTISDLMAVASDAELRADMLDQTVATIGTEDPQDASEESLWLRTIAARVRAVIDTVLAELRREGT